ncbi:hypothetical protein D3C85_1467370 [compost metagenome]
MSIMTTPVLVTLDALAMLDVEPRQFNAINVRPVSGPAPGTLSPALNVAHAPLCVRA